MTIDQDKIEQSIKDQNQNKGSNIADSLSDLMDHLSDEEKHLMFSELSDREIKRLSVLRTTGNSLMDDFIRNYMIMKVSRGRKGRKELIEVSDSISNVFGIEESGDGLLDKARGMV